MVSQGFESEEFADLLRKEAQAIAASEILLMRIRAARVSQVELHARKWRAQQNPSMHSSTRSELAALGEFEGLRGAIATLLSFERYEGRSQGSCS